MKLRTLNVLILSSLLLAACATGSKSPVAGAGAKDQRQPPLTQEEAIARFRQISHVAYTLWFGLNDESTSFDGRTVVTFDLRPKARDAGKTVFLDFNAGKIKSLIVNGTPVAEPMYDGNRITIPLSSLTPNANRIEIAYSRPFADDGFGLHRFVDKEDKRVYLYTHLESYLANRVFPCFDQPDLKASFELTVETPEAWTVISNTLERDVSKVDGRRSWAFPRSPLMSTYLFALIAGEYQMFKNKGRVASGVPQRLFARKSMAKHVDAPNWFSVTDAGLEFFGTMYGFPYPFAKYDQVLVPEFRAGAMENIAAVTFNERAIFRSPPSVSERRDRANIILHEMAHQWFGDLVTMKWWTGLWLNESFATYMAAEATDHVSGFPGTWLDFFASTKQWAYWEDSLPTTHPIDQPVADTDVADSRFDGITYGKGAASIKQLAFYLGNDDFREGLQRYFQRHAFRNTTLRDFMGALAEASGKNLTAWQKGWLLTSGTDTVTAKFTCEEGKVNAFSLVATAPPLAGERTSAAPGDPRVHRTEIAIWTALRPTHPNPTQTAIVTYSLGETKVPALVGAPCPTTVHPNFGDHDFVKTELDPVTLATLRDGGGRLNLVALPLARAQFTADLWKMVLDAKLSAADYANLALPQVTREKEAVLLDHLLDTLAHQDPRRSSVARFLEGEDRARFRTRAETAARQGLRHAAAGSEHQRLWLKFLLVTAGSEDTLRYVHRLLMGKNTLPGMDLLRDQDRRWDLLKALSREAGKPGAPSIADAEALIEAETKKDASDRGQDAALQARALLPDPARKSQWQEQFTSALTGANPAALSPSKLRAAMRAYAGLWQEALVAPGDEAYFRSISEYAPKTSPEKIYPFVSSMQPAGCDSANVGRFSSLLNSSKDLPPIVRRSLEIGRFEIERCLKVRAVKAAAN